MSSSRLPGKSMAMLGDRPTLEWVILRSLRASALERLILATTTEPNDDLVAALGEKHGLPLVRGSAEDVIRRYADVIERFPSEAVVRITGDNPLTDPVTIDRVVDFFFQNDLDYCYAAKIPYGAGADIFRCREIAFLAERVRDKRHKEHINTYFLDNHLRYRLGSLPASKEHSRPDVRVTLDTPEDLERLDALFQRLDNPEKCELSEIIAAHDALPDSLKGTLI